MSFSSPGIVLQRLQAIADVEEKLSLPHRIGAGIPGRRFFTFRNEIRIPNDAPCVACGTDKITIGIERTWIEFGPALRKVGVELLIVQGRLNKHTFLLVLDFEFSRDVHDIEFRKFAPFDPNQIISKGANVTLPGV